MSITPNYHRVLPGDAERRIDLSFSVAEIKTLHAILLDAIDLADREENTKYPVQLQLSTKLEDSLASLKSETKATPYRTTDIPQTDGVRM